jgi:hypothetical protein
MIGARDTIALYILAAGAAISGLSFVIGGFDVGIAACVGAAIAAGNWIAMRWLIGRTLPRATDAADAPRVSATRLLAFLSLKLVVLFAISYVLVVVAGLSALGFGLGLSALGFGLVLGSRSLSQLAGAEPSGSPIAGENNGDTEA